MNKILDEFFNGNDFAGYLSVTPEGKVIFGYDADWCNEHGCSSGDEENSSYMLHWFRSEEQARTTLEEWGYR